MIVDGGSTDRTVDIIKDYARQHESIRLFVEKGANVAQGRNLAIANATHDIVISIDAGCVADRFWLENYLKYFDEEVDIVTGLCLPAGKTLFEVCVGEVLYRQVDDFKAEWPSHQNFAIKKHVWEQVKYPERCYRSEDTWFNLRIKDTGFKCKLATDSIVYWRPRRNLREVYKNSYAWAKSNIENDVRASETRKIAKYNSRKLIWNLLSLLTLAVVFLFFSMIGAILLSPFVLKGTISLYSGEKNILKVLYKNAIHYTDMLGYILGYRSGINKMKKMNN